MIGIASRRRSAEGLAAEFPGARVLDVTSQGPRPWVRLSPFYPHGGIPVPFTPEVTAASVEGIWQALKVFERADVDASRLGLEAMKGIKRSVRSNGPVRGHRKGLHGDELLGYVAARRQIYLPAYGWVLRHRTPDLVDGIRALSLQPGGVLLLDYTVNDDIEDESSPLSHAGLIRRWIEGTWPNPPA